jgi:hypothetical protein
LAYPYWWPNVTLNPEIDIMELGSWLPDDNDHQSTNFHVWTTTGTNTDITNNTLGVVVDNSVDMSADFHLYGLERRDGYVKFYFDGKMIRERECSTDWPVLVTQSIALILDFEGVINGTNPVDSLLPAAVQIDYFRVYKPSNNLTGVSITQQPQNQTVSAGKAASFTISAAGSAPLKYQWQKNNISISGATDSSYTIPAASLTDSGSFFRCIVSNSMDADTSKEAILTVLPPVSSDTASCAYTIVIDGILNEPSWTSGTSRNISKIALGSAGGVTADFKVRWDSQYLFFGFDVHDDTLNNSSSSNWKNSAVEIFLDMNNGKSATYTAYDFHYLIGWNNPVLWELNNRLTGVLFKTANNTGGYQAEVAIPWTTLLVTPANGTVYGVDAAVDISHISGTRTGQLVWSGNSNDYESAGNFGILVLNGNCTATSTDPNVSQQPPLIIYPNPFQDVINMNQPGTVSIYDMNGVLQYQKQFTGDQSQINVSNLAEGIYIIKIINENGITVGKFLKE